MAIQSGLSWPGWLRVTYIPQFLATWLYFPATYEECVQVIPPNPCLTAL